MTRETLWQELAAIDVELGNLSLRLGELIMPPDRRGITSRITKIQARLAPIINGLRALEEAKKP